MNSSPKDANLKSVLEEKYLLQEKLHSDTLLDMHLAMDLKQRQTVMVKVLDRCLRYGSIAKEAMLYESRVFRACKHQALPRLLDLLRTDDYLVEVLEYFPGESVASVLQNGGIYTPTRMGSANR